MECKPLGGNRALATTSKLADAVELMDIGNVDGDISDIEGEKTGSIVRRLTFDICHLINMSIEVVSIEG